MSAYPYSTRVVEALGCRLYKSWILSCRVNYTNSFILYEFTNLKIDIWDKSMFVFFCVCGGGGGGGNSLTKCRVESHEVAI